jgi:hypothetical protein
MHSLFVGEEEVVSVITGTRFGESKPFSATTLTGPTLEGASFFAGPGVRATVAGRPPKLVVWRGDATSESLGGDASPPQMLPLPSLSRAKDTHPLHLPKEARVLVTFDQRETFALVPRETGYAVLAFAAGSTEPRLLYRTEDDPAQLPTHERLHMYVHGGFTGAIHRMRVRP